MRVSIGILAHNEERVLGRTIASLCAQTLVRDGEPGVEQLQVVVVPNGCRDDTAGAARAALTDLVAAQNANHTIAIEVRELAQPGKSAAWNRYVHEFADPAADYLILMDADVRFGEHDTLARLVKGLIDTPSAYASVDTPLKLLPRPRPWDIVGRLSLAASEMALRGEAKIAGSLYCIRGEIVRRIWMPIGLPVEDGFVKGMLNTEFFTQTRSPSRVIRVEGTSHHFEPQVKVATALRHEQRMIVGAVLNAHVYTLLWAKGRETDVGIMIRDLNQQNPNWLRDYCNTELEKRGYWRVPKDLMFKRLVHLRHYGLKDAIRRSPIALAGAALSVVASFPANRTLRSGTAVGFW